MPRPNILWIMCDELRTDALSCYGAPFAEIRTPNIDRIAAQGTRFANCFCTSPICVPTRTSLMTASYAETTGVYGNEGSWQSYVYDRDLPTFPELFARHGYRTVNLGKTHLPPQMRPWAESDPSGAAMTKFYEELPPGVRPEIIRTPALDNAIAGSWPEGLPFPGETVTRNAVGFLESQGAKADPYLLRVSFLQPHTPVLPPLAYARRYAHLPWRRGLDLDYETSRFEARFAEALGAFGLTPDEAFRVQADYYGLVAWVDDQVGEILAALERTGRAEDTIIVFDSDHGTSLGEAGRLQKQTFAPEAHRIARIVAWPGHVPGGTVRDDICESFDLARTFCGLADIPPEPSFRGRDVFVDDTPAAVFGTLGYGERHSLALPNVQLGDWYDGTGWPRRSCVRTDRWRLDMTVRRNGGPVAPDDEDVFLADWRADPQERRNLAADPAHAATVVDLRARLLRHVAGNYEPPHVPGFAPGERGLH